MALYIYCVNAGRHRFALSLRVPCKVLSFRVPCKVLSFLAAAGRFTDRDAGDGGCIRLLGTLGIGTGCEDAGDRGLSGVVLLRGSRGQPGRTCIKPCWSTSKLMSHPVRATCCGVLSLIIDHQQISEELFVGIIDDGGGQAAI